MPLRLKGKKKEKSRGFIVHQKIYFILCMSFLILTSCGEKTQTTEETIRTVKTFHISGPEEVAQRSFPGKVDASKKADLAFLVPGKIIEFPVKAGDQVEQGQVIAKLDPKDFEIIVQETKTKAEYEKAQLERKATLVEKQFVSKAEYEAQKTSYDVAVANLETAQQNLIYATLLAPFPGEVSVRYVENYQTIKVNEPIIRLQNRDLIDINVQIPENVAISFNKASNPQISAEFDSAPGTRYPVKVKEVSSKADPETQTYKLTLIMPAPSGLNIFPGMTATVYVSFNLPTETKNGKYMIPISAVFGDEQNNSYVWVLDPLTGSIKKQQVKLGPLENESVSVIEGLSPGMDIVAAGAKFLTEGMKVRALPVQGE